jgi:hypothetical protein
MTKLLCDINMKYVFVKADINVYISSVWKIYKYFPLERNEKIESPELK